jgi:hypothetical protein
VLAAEHATRTPMLLLSLSGLFLLRLAERQFSGLLLKEPPRISLYACPKPILNLNQSFILEIYKKLY